MSKNKYKNEHQPEYQTYRQEQHFEHMAQTVPENGADEDFVTPVSSR